MKKIHFHIYDPAAPSLFKSKASDKAEAHFIECDQLDCPLLKKGQCIRRIVFGKRCVYGRNYIEIGYTKRSKAFSKWIREKREENKEVGSLKAPPSKICKIGDYVWLPYPHMDMNKEIFENPSEPFITGTPFIKFENFNVATILSILKFRPRALFGGEITSYQKEVIPLFLMHLKEFDPVLFEQVEQSLGKKLFVRSNVGRQAYLRTISPGEIDFGGNEKYEWDGEKLVFTGEPSKITLWLKIKDPVNFSMEIIPNKEAVVTITNENQVNNGTEFYD